MFLKMKHVIFIFQIDDLLTRKYAERLKSIKKVKFCENTGFRSKKIIMSNYSIHTDCWIGEKVHRFSLWSPVFLAGNDYISQKIDIQVTRHSLF